MRLLIKIVKIINYQESENAIVFPLNLRKEPSNFFKNYPHNQCLKLHIFL